LGLRAFRRFASYTVFRTGHVFFFAGACFTAGFRALWNAVRGFSVAPTIAALPASLGFRFVLSDKFNNGTTLWTTPNLARFTRYASETQLT
jgi:hypothetical protein